MRRLWNESISKEASKLATRQLTRSSELPGVAKVFRKLFIEIGHLTAPGVSP